MAFPTTNLKARYEAKSETGLVDNDPVGTAVDQSGNSWPLTQATAGKKPLFKTGILNGHPVYRFDGTDDTLDRASAALGLTTAVTISVVTSSGAAEGTTRAWPFGINVAGGTNEIFAFTEGVTAGEWGSFIRPASNPGTVQQPTSGVNTTTWTVLTLTHDGTNAVFYRNGTQVASTARTGSWSASHGMGMGALQSITTEFFSGDVALAAVWSAALDTTARADLHTYVQDTYGIAVSDYNGGVTGSGTVTVAYTLSGTGLKRVTGAGTVAVTYTLGGTGTRPGVRVGTGTGTVGVTYTLGGVGARRVVAAGTLTVMWTLGGSGRSLHTLLIFRTPVRMAEGPRLPTVPNPTTVFDGGREGFGLMRHVNRGGGRPVAVLVTGGVVTEKAVPTQADLDAADFWYLGGRENVVSEAEAAILTAAGYTVIEV